MTTENTMTMPRFVEPTSTKPCPYIGGNSSANTYAFENLKRSIAKTSKVWAEYVARRTTAPRCPYARTMDKPIRLSR